MLSTVAPPAGTRRRLAGQVAVAAASLVVSLLALEAGLRLLDRYVMIYDIEMWKYAKYLKRQAADPAIGHEHVPNARARLDGVEVAINSHGLRDREDHRSSSRCPRRWVAQCNRWRRAR